jgi:hypothetical protein
VYAKLDKDAYAQMVRRVAPHWPLEWALALGQEAQELAKGVRAVLLTVLRNLTEISEEASCSVPASMSNAQTNKCLAIAVKPAVLAGFTAANQRPTRPGLTNSPQAETEELPARLQYDKTGKSLSSPLISSRLSQDFISLREQVRTPSLLVLGLYQEINALFQKNYDVKELPLGDQIVCKRGCSLCCRLKVQTTALEVLGIAELLRVTRMSEQLEELRDKLPETPRVSLERYPCPLLSGSDCSIYNTRPLGCCGMTSMSLDACRYAAKHVDENPNIPMGAFHKVAADLWGVAIMSGQAQACLETGSIEFLSALRVALTVPNVTEHWLAGEDVFADCKDSEDPRTLFP